LAEIEQVGFIGGGDAAVDRYPHWLAVFAFFGGDDDHAVAGPGAPDGCCGSVFQDGDVLDVVGVDIGGVAFIGEIIDD